MEVFPWSPSFETDVGTVDAQHRHLVELINGLGTLLAEGGEVPAPALERTIEELRAYASYHFLEEETLMVEAQVDRRHQERQHREHGAFRAYVAAALEAGGTGAGEPTRLLTYLVHWLTYHILGADQALGRQVHAIRAGTPPAQAFEREGQSEDPVSRLLLGSVSELFVLLSSRNRELTELNRNLERRVLDRTQALSAANDELLETMAKVERMAMTDSLTELPNRRHAMTWLAGTWANAVRHGRPLSCLLVDADDFKQVNDSSGHEAGDRVLVQLARALRAGAREGDEVCRLGGDEFLVICPETTLEGALALGERLRAAVSGQRVEVEGGAWSGSVSVGAATMREGMESFDELLRAADAAVYQAKRSGRNRVAAAVAGGAASAPPTAPGSGGRVG
jgi:diguanylate cyclase (GGDEF)-like protein/hemerythrin-like metal-binding protein